MKGYYCLRGWFLSHKRELYSKQFGSKNIGIRNKMNLFKEIMKFILWLIIRCVYIILRRIIWTLNGVEKQVKSNKNSNVYEKTVHVRKIWMRYNFDPSLLPCTESHYITTHERFEDPEYVLKPNITLYNVKENEVYFVESDVSKDVLNSENGGFVKFAQYKLARKFLVMPMSVFIRLCETLPKPQDQKLVFIGNTARSGSTLFTQVSALFTQVGIFSHRWASFSHR